MRPLTSPDIIAYSCIIIPKLIVLLICNYDHCIIGTQMCIICLDASLQQDCKSPKSTISEVTKLDETGRLCMFIKSMPFFTWEVVRLEWCLWIRLLLLLLPNQNWTLWHTEDKNILTLTTQNDTITLTLIPISLIISQKPEN